MTPGDHADVALTHINKASGQLGRMVIWKALSKREIKLVIVKLEYALDQLREIIK